MKLKSMMVQMGLSGVLAMATMATIPAVHAFGLGDLKAAAGGGESAEQGGVDVKALLSQQQDLMGRFNSSMYNMLLAQSKTLAAIDSKKEADIASAAAENFKTGNVQSKEQLDRAVEITESANKTIQQKSKESGQLSSEGQKLLVSAVPHYAKGMYDGTRLPKDFESWTSSAQGGLNSLASNPLDAGKLSSGLKDVTTVATSLPSLLKTWGSTSAAFVNYAKSNKVDVSDVESKLGDL